MSSYAIERLCVCESDGGETKSEAGLGMDLRCAWAGRSIGSESFSNRTIQHRWQKCSLQGCATNCNTERDAILHPDNKRPISVKNMATTLLCLINLSWSINIHTQNSRHSATDNISRDCSLPHPLLLLFRAEHGLTRRESSNYIAAFGILDPRRCLMLLCWARCYVRACEVVLELYYKNEIPFCQMNRAESCDLRERYITVIC